MRCSKCGFDNPEGMKFCGQCTTALALICRRCHFENPPGFKFCAQCTTTLGPASPKRERPEATTVVTDRLSSEHDRIRVVLKWRGPA